MVGIGALMTTMGSNAGHRSRDVHHRDSGRTQSARCRVLAPSLPGFAGIGDMASAHRPGIYGEQLWNRFARIYPGNMARHHAPG